MSKARWEQIVRILHTTFGEDQAAAVEDALRQIQGVLQFDPGRSTYTPEQAQHNRRWEARRAEETGQSVYIASGKREYYRRRRDAAAAATASVAGASSGSA